MKNRCNILFLAVILIFIYSCNTTQKKEETQFKNDVSIHVESIHEKVFVKSNDAELFVEIKGEDKTKPVILFLHGGPGDVALGLLPFQVYAGKILEKNFVVAYLHQRGLVNSSIVPDSTQTIENHIADVGNVVNFLTEKLNRKKISLMGHSWGGLLSTLYLLQDDRKVEKFVAIANPFNFKKTNSESFNYTMKWATSTQNTEAIKELSEQATLPINTFDKLMIKSKWASQAYGGIGKNISIEKIINETEYDEFKREWQIATLRIAKAMFQSLNTIHLEDDINKITIPILFIAGKNDANIPPNTIQEVYSSYKSKKEFVLFENSHHLIFVDEPELFSAKVKEFLSK